jgi:phosphoglycolate phosphatase-like HAD superfamily hydrolase
MPKCVILDFDGTFTDVEIEGAPFVEAFRHAVGDLVGRDVDEDWARHVAEVDARPDVFGWEYEGHLVAPANADPYIRATTVGQRIFTQHGVLSDPTVRLAIVQAFYHLAYQRSATAFRPTAREVLATLAQSSRPVYIVTNSSSEVVSRKLRELNPPGLEGLEVIGDARKYAVVEPRRHDARFDAVPTELHLPGLTRAISPRRGHYFDVLAGISERTGIGFRDMIVCGDIYELDLVLPLELGMQVHLVTGPQTPAYERGALVELEPRSSTGTLDELLLRIEG